MPCMLTMVLVVLGFTLSPETCEKVGLQISVSLAICIFLTINERDDSTHIRSRVFFQSCMVISVLATSFTVFVQSYHFRSQHNTLRMTFWIAVIIAFLVMRFILLEWAPWFLRMEFPDRKNTIETMKESWSNRNRKRRGTITAFDYVQVSSKIKDDEKLLQRIRVLQKIHDHVK
ncbi:hypothetical protein OSTOST_22906, partial [Ostertagia ostertagi]